MTRESLVHLIALSRIPQVGPILTRQLISYCGGVEAVFEASASALAKIPQIGPVTAKIIIEEKNVAAAERIVSQYEKQHVTFTAYLDENYPKRLLEIHDAPVVLFSRGVFNYNASRTVAMVGTRSITEYGKIMADRLVEELKPYGVQIISGLAYGVDAACHRASVKHGIETIAVLGSGVDNIYPSSHRDLAEKMCAHGGVISEFNPGDGPDREHFPMRNRVIAGMSDALVVVESKYKGGSMISADFAFSFSRDVFAVPGRVDDPMSAGPNKLIRTGKAQLVHTGSDIARAMIWEKDGSITGKQSTLLLDFSPEEQLLVTALRKKTKASLDELHYASQLSTSEIASIMLQLEFKNVVKSLPGNRFVLL